MAKANDVPLPYIATFKPRSRAEFLATKDGHIRNKMMLDDLYRRIVPEDVREEVRQERERIQELVRLGREMDRRREEEEARLFGEVVRR